MNSADNLVIPILRIQFETPPPVLLWLNNNLYAPSEIGLNVFSIDCREPLRPHLKLIVCDIGYVAGMGLHLPI